MSDNDFTITQRGNIIVEKQTEPDGDLTIFTFSGDASGSIGDGQEIVEPVLPGSYSSSETVPNGWNLTDITCDDPTGDSSGDTATGTATFNVAAGETVRCIFTNSKRGSIIVEKQTSPAGAAGTFTFTGDAAGTISDGEQIVVADLLPGTYTATEDNPGSDFDLSDITCDDDNSGGDVGTRTATFRLEGGETVKCIFTNSKRGSIIVEKQTSPDGAAGSFTFSGDAAGSISDGETIVVSDLAPGAYTATEDNPGSDFDLSDITCDDDNSTGDVGTRTATFQLEAGEAVKCTFTNAKQSVETATGTGTVAFESDACVIQDLIAVAEATLPTAGKPNMNFEHGFFSFKLVTCTPGQTVVVTMVFPSDVPVGTEYWKYQDGVGWYQIPVGDDDGDNVITIALTDGGLGDADGLINGEIDDPGGPGVPYGTIIVEKQTSPDGAAGSFTFSGDVAGAISDDGQIVVGDLEPGTYTATEADPSPEFELTAISCNDGNSSGDVGTRTATFHIEAGETVKCTFTNAHLSLKVTKELELPVGGLAAVDQIVRFLITVENDGSLTMDPLTLRDDYDSWCLRSRRAEVPPDLHGGMAGFLQWNDLGALAPGESMSLWVEFTANHACEEATNRATVEAGGLTFEDEAAVRILETSARVGGFIFHDDNGDGMLNFPCRGTDVDPATCEPGLEQATAETTLPSGKLYGYDTNTSGWYSFNLLDPGTYRVEAAAPGGSWWTPTTAEECDATVVNNWDQVFCHFGYWWGLDGPAVAAAAVAEYEVALTPTQDATISEWNGANEGHNEHLRVRQPGVASALLRFDLSGLPDGAEIVAASLKLYSPFASNRTNRLYMTAYPLDKMWAEDEVTWMQAENGLPWTEAGATGDHGDPVGWAWSDAPGWVEFDLDPAEVLANDYGYLVRGEGSENREVSYWFFSREYVNAGVQPQLVVGYNVP